jgi:hypothetical protein
MPVPRSEPAVSRPRVTGTMRQAPGGGVVWVILVLGRLSEVPRQEINDLLGGVAEVR